MLDFIEQLRNHVEELGLGFPIAVGSLDRDDSISLYALPGGKKLRVFQDGTKDKLLNYEFAIKTKRQKRAIETLDTIADDLEEVEDIPSQNGSYDFREITVSSEPYLAGQDTQGFFFYQLTITPELTIYKQKEVD